MCSPGLRSALLALAVLVGWWTALGTELLSALSQLRPGPVAAWWVCGALVTAVLLLVSVRCARREPSLPHPDRTETGTRPRLLPALGLLAIASILATTFAIAITTPPNTWDTLQYHLARVVYWLQQGHVGHFPAGDLRLLEMPPLAEYFAAHILLLTGQDRFVNLIQWSAFGLSIGAASLIARELALAAQRDPDAPRPTRPAEVLAGVLAATIPAAATQAVNGKNDILVALWLAIALWVAIRAWRLRQISLPAAALAGGALALAILTKGTAYIFGLPVCILLGLAILRARGPHHSIRPGLIIIALVLAINLPFISRNSIALGSPISLPREKGGFPIKMEDHSPRAIASNIIRNATIHTSTPWPEINDAQQRAVGAFHDWIDQPIGAPRTTLRGSEYRIISTWHSDGNNPAPLHLLLGIVVIGAVVLRPRHWWRQGLAHAAAVPLLGFLLFCTLLVWQPWHARLHIPGLILLVPAAAALVARGGAPVRMIAGLAAFALVWPGILTNEAKPLIGPRSIWRADDAALRYHQRPHEQRPIEAGASLLAELNPRLVALDLRRSPGVYSVQRTLLDALPGARLMEFRPRFGILPPDFPTPEIVLSWRTHGRPLKIRDSRGHEYSAFADLGQLILYRPGEPDPAGLAFIGWGRDEGLFPGQGRDPGNQLRWGHGPRTRLWFSTREETTQLVLDLKPGNIPGQTLTIRLNGEILETIDLPTPGPFREIRRNLPTLPGRNTLSLEYAGGEPTGLPPARAVLYRRIQLLPGSKLAPPRGAAPAPLEEIAR